MIEITFLSKDTIGIIDTRVYQVDHGRCITIYLFVLWVNLLGREGNKKALRNNLEIKKKKTQTILDNFL
jgi:hypothetical protein